MTKQLLFNLTIAAMVFATAATVSAAPVSYATIDIGPNGQRVEPGGIGLPGAPAANVNGTTYGPTSLTSDTSDSFSIAISTVDWRDRGDSANGAQPLVQLGEDFVKHNDGTITVTLDSLPAGKYDAVSYHHDAPNAQSPRIQVYVSDAVSSNRLQPTQGDASQAGGLAGLTTTVMQNTAATFEFYSNGADPVVLRFNGTPGTSNNDTDDETPVNGLVVTLDDAAPTPILSSYALIDIGPTGQRVESGGLGLPSAPAANTNNTNYGATTLVSDTADSFTIAIDNVNQSGSSVGGIDWRDRGNSTSTQALAHVGEDHVKNNLGIIRVTLGSLPAGTFRVESYHNDSATGNTLQCENVLVYVTDAIGTNVLQDLAGDADHPAQALNSLTTNGVLGTGSSFFVESNGTDVVILIFDGAAAVDDEVPLNGLRLETYVIPEPSTFVLAAIGLLGLIGWGRRRRFWI